MNVDDILTDIIQKEGGFVSHPRDGGGPTCYGITIGTLSQYYGRKATIDEVKNLSIETAKEIYSREYYYKPMFHTIPELIQPIVVDTGVLFGPVRATKFMQSICNQANFGIISEDGVLGNLSRAAIANAVNAMDVFFINAMVEERILAHKIRVQERPDQEVFLAGWINRAESFRVQV